MKNYIQAWRTSILSESNPLVLNEGLFDIGLPAEVAEAINKNFEGVPEKGKTMIGNIFKNQSFKYLSGAHSAPLMNDVNYLLNIIKDISSGMINKNVGEKESGRVGVTDQDSNWVNSLSHDEREKMSQFWHNMEVILTGDKGGITDASTQHWDVKIGDVQKVIKLANKAFKKGIVAQINGGAIDSGYNEMIESLASHIYEDYARTIGELTLNIQIWLKSQKDEYKKIPKIIEKSDRHAYTALVKYAKIWILDNEVEEQKIKTFNDTSYWYDLKTDSCPVEADRMGHCGGDGRASTLLSLRHKNKDKQKSSSYITVAYNPDRNTIYQIKGKFNKAPEEKYYKHIAWLIKEFGDPQVLEIGEHSDDLAGFAKMSEWLRNNTNADIAEMKDLWGEMEVEISEIIEYNNQQEYFYSKIFAEMADPRGQANPEMPSFYMRGYVGVPIELEELSEEGRQKIKDNKFTKDEVKEISRLMDDPRASGKFSGEIGPPPIVEGDYVIFFFYVADLITAGASGAEWYRSENISDLERFADDIKDMDREAGNSGNRLQRDLIRALISTEFMKGGPFMNLYTGARDGELQEHSDWVVETDVGADDDPKLVWFQTPQIYFDLNRLVSDGIHEEYYRKPQVVEKILNSNDFKNQFMLTLSSYAMVSNTIFPNIQTWEVNFENYNPPKFVIEAAWMVNTEDNESKAEVAERWLNAEFGKGEFEEMLHHAYLKTLNEAFDLDWRADQQSMDFPDGRRVEINESMSHKNILKNWKNFKGF